MAEPSDYELDAWRNVQRFTGRPLSRFANEAGQHAVGAAKRVGDRTSRYLERHPRTQTVVRRGQAIAARSGHTAARAARKVGESLPSWVGPALDAARRTTAKVARIGLTPRRVVALHRKRGHDVVKLRDVRRLDLEQIDAVRGRGPSWYYPAAAALSGAGAGLLISGGQLVTAASAGAAAAPSAGVVIGTFAADTAVVLGVASRAVGHVSLLYGFDPEDPAEKLFVMSVVNAGTAVSAGAKAAALRDISMLTQALVRGKTWAVLEKSVVAKVSVQFSKAFSVRLTKQGLGKIVPAVGIVLGGTFNWTTLESIVDAADVAYRRRVLLEKYPQLTADDAMRVERDAEIDADDETISVLDELDQVGGPDIR